MYRLLRARKSSRRPGLPGRPIRTPSEELVLGGERSTSSTYPLLLGSWSQLLRQRGREVSGHRPNAQKAKWTSTVGTTCVPKSRGWDMPRMRRGVGLRAGRHGEWHGPCSLRPKDSMSNSPSRRTSCPRRPASSTISTTSARLRRRRRRSGRAGRPARQA